MNDDNSETEFFWLINYLTSILIKTFLPQLFPVPELWIPPDYPLPYSKVKRNPSSINPTPWDIQLQKAQVHSLALRLNQAVKLGEGDSMAGNQNSLLDN